MVLNIIGVGLGVFGIVYFVYAIKNVVVWFKTYDKWIEEINNLRK